MSGWGCNVIYIIGKTIQFSILFMASNLSIKYDYSDDWVHSVLTMISEYYIS